MFAPPICRRRWRNNALPFRQIRRRRWQPSEHRRERSEQPKQSDVRAADLQEEMAEQRSSVPPDPTKTVATQRTSPRAERAIRTERDARAAEESSCERRESRAGARRRRERRCFSSVCCSLPLAADRARKPPTLSSLTDEEHVGSLLRSTAARGPVRATTTAATQRTSPRAERAIESSAMREQLKRRMPLPFGDMSDHAKQILADSFGRVRELVIELTDRLTDDIANYRPDPGANSIAWLIWHLSRVQDDHVADLAQAEQVWPQWRERFALPFGRWATGYGQGPTEVAAVRASGDLLSGYHQAVHELTMRYVARITPAELERIVDTRWDPPVTAAVRLVSVIGDTMQHLGQAAYVRGLAERRDSAWHQSGAAER